MISSMLRRRWPAWDSAAGIAANGTVPLPTGSCRYTCWPVSERWTSFKRRAQAIVDGAERDTDTFTLSASGRIDF